MKVDRVVIKETLNIAIGMVVSIAIMQAVFALVGQYSLGVLYGSLYGGAVAIINFFAMGVSLQKASSIGDAEAAKKAVQVSYAARQFMVVAAIGVGMYLATQHGIFNWVALVLPIFFPKFIIYFMRFFRKDIKNGDDKQ